MFCKQIFCEQKNVYTNFVYKIFILDVNSHQMKKLRAQLGLTQTDMSKLIGSGKTKGSLYENGLRNLNDKELGMLSTIELLMENAAEIQATEQISLNDQKELVAMLKKLTYHQRRAELKCETLREKLSRMDEAYASNRKLWRLLHALKTSLKGTLANPYAGILEIKCLEKLKSCGLHQQVLIRYQLSILEGEMASVQQIIEEYKGFGVPVMR